MYMCGCCTMTGAGGLVIRPIPVPRIRWSPPEPWPHVDEYAATNVTRPRVARCGRKYQEHDDHPDHQQPYPRWLTHRRLRGTETIGQQRTPQMKCMSLTD